MHIHAPRIWRWVLAVAILLSPTVTISAQTTAEREQQRQETERALEALREQIQSLQTNQQKNRSQLSNEQKALKEADIAINRSNQRLRATRKSLRESQQSLKKLKQREQRLNSDKRKQQQALAKQIRTAYMNGNQEYIKLLLNQEDPAKVARSIAYYDYLNKARAEKIATLKTTIRELNQVITEIAVEETNLRELAERQQAENNNLTSLKNRRVRVVAQLEQQVTSNEKKLQEWQANELDLVSILDALKTQVAKIIPEQALEGLSQLGGKLNWPVVGKLRERFGVQRQNSTALWSGILITTDAGKEIQAIHHGRVVYSDYLRGFGLMTIIDHGDGYMSLYGHSEALFKSAGDWVEAGERIAMVGQTGGYPEPGLYFEIRHRSKAVNPMRFIASR
ncbi:MAG: peptidoglycan DD-metalloendopeptidase family protein [Gammaproteobacteria bacterium]